MQFLKLDSLGLLVQNYINKFGLYIITNQKRMLLDVFPKRDANGIICMYNVRKTLSQQIKDNNSGLKKDSDGNVFFDITEEEADLIISHKDLLVRHIDKNYSIPITELARKLGIIKEYEAIYPPELLENCL